jgi:hypothetical protein
MTDIAILRQDVDDMKRDITDMKRDITDMKRDIGLAETILRILWHHVL